MQCPKCNAINQEGARFCASCGAPLPASAPQNSVPPQYAQQPVQPPQQPPVQQPSAPSPQPYAQPVQQPYAPQPAQHGAATSAPPKKSKTGIVVAAILVALVVLIAGVFLAVKLFKADHDPTKQTQTETGPNSTVTTEPEKTTAKEQEPEQTTETLQGAADNDFSVLYGEWIDQSEDHDLYISPDGVFSYSTPGGTYTGQIERQGSDYRLKADGNPSVLDDASITLEKDGSRSLLRLHTSEAAVTFDFFNKPEKDEMFDWMLIDYSSDKLEYYPNYDECRVDQSLYSAELIMIPNYPLRDVKLLSLEMVDMTQNGDPVCKMSELYSQSALMRLRPLVFEITIVGDLPNRGISFVDPEGVAHYYEIYYSGEDGSVRYAEFVPY